MTRLLAADIGNGHTHLGVLADGEVLADWLVGTDENRTADEWAALVRSLGGAEHLLDDLDGVAVCCTVPRVLAEWRDLVRRSFGEVPAVIVEPGVRTGIPVLTDNPREVGADRIMNALAAATYHPGASVVVDFATATTFDVVTSAGQYVGGAIAPGVEISQRALSRYGSQLRNVELVRPRSVIAKNTVEALQSGMLHGFASLVDGVVDRMTAELAEPGPVNVIATGHLAPLLYAECRVFTHHSPWLTLLGLERVFAKNS